MRALILSAAAALALTACSNDEAGNTAVNVDQAIAPESISANDITAIDAVTAEDANMAADVNFIEENVAANDSNASGGRASRNRPAPRPAPSTPRAEPEPAEPEPAANTAE